MKTSDFNFNLPNKLLSEYPNKYRDESKLMVVNKKKNTIEHKTFKNIIDYFIEGDVIVLNNTKVFPARLYGRKEKTNAKIEVFLLRELNKEEKIWDILVDPARKVRVGNKIYFNIENDMQNPLILEIIDNTTSKGRIGKFISHLPINEFKKEIQNIGQVPLPKYIKREPNIYDLERYQTIYAKEEGSVAVPSAGLHFSKNLIKRLEVKGIKIVFITLHIGLGSFNQLEVEDLSKHKMDSEKFHITKESADSVNNAIKNKKKICVVGTSTMRAVESSVSTSKLLNPNNGWTNKFIFPPYKFNIANYMITNFHMPKSPLLMMTVAFAGYNLAMKAYKLAIENKYKFYSYGDAMLII
jgi:S-adenosylmethionine:tRNA ribosyltransferase-isomerase